MEMESSGDLLDWLGYDVSIIVFTLLDDPADLVRATSVSRSWRRFAVKNGICKKLCIGMFPELSCFTHVIDLRNSIRPAEIESTKSNLMGPAEAGSSNAVEWYSLELEHKVYARIACDLKYTAKTKHCILESVFASSTDNYPDEGIENTLHSRYMVGRRPSYWSSEGESDPGVPETLVYRLCSKLCVVEGVKILPFKALFQYGHPIYSAKAVRFRLGYLKTPLNTTSKFVDETAVGDKSKEDDYIWNYVSPTFPMLQENHLQTFELPQPVLCIGGILQIELLGRVQKQDMDGLYYICMCHVQVVGRPLSLAFDVEISSFMRSCVLKYSPEVEEDCKTPSRSSGDELVGESTRNWQTFAARIRQVRRQRVGIAWGGGALVGNVQQVDDTESSSDDGDDTDDYDDSDDDDDDDDDGGGDDNNDNHFEV